MAQRKNLDILINYLEFACGGGDRLNASGQRKILPLEAEEIIWPLNAHFRDIKSLNNVPYETSNEPLADKAIEQFIATGGWGPMSIGVKRVMSERHAQTLMSIQLKKLEPHAAVTVVPDVLPERFLLGALLLIIYHQAALPFPVKNQIVG